MNARRIYDACQGRDNRRTNVDLGTSLSFDLARPEVPGVRALGVTSSRSSGLFL